MLTWLQNNIGTIVICAIIIAIVCLIIVFRVKNKKAGKSSCGCGCSNCAMNDSCHSKKK